MPRTVRTEPAGAEARLYSRPAAPVAQLDRAPGFEPGGSGFESLRVRQIEPPRQRKPFVRIDAPLVRRLIREQFPEHACLNVTQVLPGGHDNRTFRIGDQLAARLPSAVPYAAHVPVEYEFLPQLAEALPFEIPEPIALGAPGCGYPWRWTLNRWIPGEPASPSNVRGRDRLAQDLGDFLHALHAIDTADAPGPGPANFHRGGDLAVYEDETLGLIERLQPQIDAPRAALVWESARRTGWTKAPVWVHGDLAPDNLLLRDGRLCAVIDFGQLAAGDPACDVTIAWTLLDEPAATAFAQRLELDEGTWARARGWALWKELQKLDNVRSSNAAKAQRIRRVIARITRDL